MKGVLSFNLFIVSFISIFQGWHWAVPHNSESWHSTLSSRSSLAILSDPQRLSFLSPGALGFENR